MAAARLTLLRASRSWSSALAATAAFMRGPSSRFIGPIALDTRSRPAATASSGLAPTGASAIPSVSSWLSVSCPATRISRLSGKYRKKVLFVTPARSASCVTVVASYPCSVKRSTAARTSRSRTPGSHLATGPAYVMGLVSYDSATVTGQRSHHLQGEFHVRLRHRWHRPDRFRRRRRAPRQRPHRPRARRSEASGLALKSAGAEPLRGNLTDLNALRSGAAQADGVIHLAFGNDFSSPDALGQAVAEEGAALAALGEGLLGSDRPLVTVSGTPPMPGRVSTETDPLPPDGPVGGRSRAVMAVLDLASRGVRSSAVRMPRTVHNEGKGGFAGMLTEIARRTGVSGYPGDGTQRWPAVHALDAAVLFRLALELAPAGTSWHAGADEGDAVRDIATVIGRRLELPVETVPQETYGPLGPIFATDQPSSSTHTRKTLGWEPTHPSLLEDLENIQP